MNCPMCAAHITQHVEAKHLPHFFRCTACGGYYPKIKEMPVYPETYFVQTEKPSVLQRVLNIFLLLREKDVRSLLPAHGGRVLDYGCGNGKLVAYLRKKGINVEGYDPSPGAVSLAQKNNLPVFSILPDKKYDLIMFWHSLEHTDTPLADLERIKKYLTPVGKLLIAVPNGDSIEAHIVGGTWFCYDWPYHRVHFTPQSLRMCLERAGFRITSIDLINPEYTLSSIAQTFLNLVLPKNALYSAVANRRVDGGYTKAIILSVISALLLIIFSPLLLVFFLIALITGRTAAMIVVAELRDI